MPRIVTVAGAQLGPIARHEPRTAVVARLIDLMRRARARGAEMVVFPELALTTFFPRWWIEDEKDLDWYYESSMPNPAVQPLFDESKRLGVGFYLGYAELAQEGNRKRRFNTAILVDKTGTIVGKYRKVHLPGHADHNPTLPWQHLEKRYFEPGDLGFPVWRVGFEERRGILGMMICNDRRWPESYRVMGLKGVELVMLGYNTPAMNRNGVEAHYLRVYHSNLVVCSGAYQNGTWVVAVAKAGKEEGFDMCGSSIIVAPSGEIVAQTHTLGDELIVADCDLDECQFNKSTIFAFHEHRRPETYGLITSQTGAKPPPDGHSGPY
jgi:predicted amidohydrolase